MDASDKVREMRDSIQKSATEAKSTRSRIEEIKTLLAEKKKRDEELAAAQKEEAELLAQLNS
jgi:hypothetical protein